MFSLLYWICGIAIAILYGVLGILFYRLARRPTCRLCLNRSTCPRRIGGLPQILREPDCMASGEGRSAKRSSLRSLSTCSHRD